MRIIGLTKADNEQEINQFSEVLTGTTPGTPSPELTLGSRDAMPE